jgi:diguanylate cyclase (GGDEF)-like protein/PAS domain S-box-containing protein
MTDNSETMAPPAASAPEITAHGEADTSLLASEAWFRLLVEQAPEAILVYDVDADRFIEANRRAESLFGYGRDELLRLGPKDFYPTEQPDKRPVDVSFAEHNKRALEEGLVYERRIRNAQGREAICEVRLGRLPSAKSCLLRASFIDITTRKLAESALARERDFSTTLIGSLPGLVVVIDDSSRLIRWNEGLRALIGLSDGELQGLDAIALVVEKDRDMARARMREAFSRGFAEIEFGVRTKSGDVQNLHFSGRIITNEGQRPYLLAAGTNVTKQIEAERRLRESEERFRTIFDSINDGIIVHDIDTGAFIDVNQRLCAMFGYSREEMLRLSLGDLSAGVSPYTREDAAPLLRRSASGPPVLFEWLCKAKDGHQLWIEVSLRRAQFGGREVLMSAARDISKRKKVENELRASETKYRDLFEHTLDAIMTLDPSTGRFLSANHGTVKLFGTKDEEEFILGTPWDYSPEWQPDGRASVEKAHEMIETAIREGSHLFEWTHKRIDGVEFPADVLLTPVVYGEETLIYATVRDVTERKRAEEQISRMARYDNLTGLVNRQVFVEALEVAVARERRNGRCFALLYLDLDHFKDVNDTLGHPVGDLLLVAVAARLRASVRELDTVARFGGDEFAVLVSDIEEPADAATVTARLLAAIAEPIAIQEAAGAAAAAGVTDKILHAISEPYSIQGNEIRSGATVGIAVYGPDIPDIETMLSHADVALYRAKSEARGAYRFFSDAMDTEVRARVALGTELREAIASEQLFLMYQPQVELDTGRIVGLEALVRWQHPTRGTVGPGYFIPEAERNGLIVPLGHWVMREACHQAKKWLDAGIAPPLVAVNLSGVQFKRPLELEKDIAAILAESGLPARSLELELTESALMDASREHNDLLLRFRKAGYRIAIDDFGSGYSSLDYLRRFPVDRIKIAQSFIADIGQEPGNDAIVRASLGLARELAIEVVVEGVETAAQLELLKGWGSRVVQGFYFSRPLAVPELTELLRIGRITPKMGGLA